MVLTFTLRDATWVTNEGDEYAPVIADDFVAGLQHPTDFQGQTLYIAEMFIEGLAVYSHGKTTDFSSVGVKATVDGKSVTYTLTEPTPYFESVASYTLSTNYPEHSWKSRVKVVNSVTRILASVIS